ncbi:GNAT family N-acetyltransferase [Hymenobacter sp. BT186]|uniref:GNAT family N-acetyltransferase n=1 Tax=Hymenobacter telluris TaxID=2816474 RepID=A0A939ETE3_9BACT|nr:GNAT family N-acetyltransferase [Hymenobacter telluris]MBO0357108.1 GNAT family N-acetyltransferase [Hymenobacter telluris]MBW3373135.1 GNAT family N-acetyltransferase [Hymenobacter norwichensis]
MSSPLVISVARRNAATAAQLAALGRQTFQDTFAADNSPEDMAAYLAATFSEEKQLAELEDKDTVFLLARMQQELVGYAKLNFNSTLGVEPGKKPDVRMEIARLYVREDWVGTGLGASLMRRIIEEARQQACRSVVLGVWEKNQRAIAFYQRFGFKVIGQHEFSLGSDKQNDLIMRKGL